MICIFPVALEAGLGVVEDDLIAEGLVCISQRRIVYSQKRELGRHNLRKVCSYPRHWRGWRSSRIYLLTSFLLQPRLSNCVTGGCSAETAFHRDLAGTAASLFFDRDGHAHPAGSSNWKYLRNQAWARCACVSFSYGRTEDRTLRSTRFSHQAQIADPHPCSISCHEIALHASASCPLL